ncbi:MAG: glycosyltransferase family 4 protein [Spirochaetes bacterium]|nr:glycosyltransferase family 4 protein [Spirochaetota bacterium]
MLHNFYQQPGGEDIVLSEEKQLLKQKGNTVSFVSVDNKHINNFRTKLYTAVNLAYSKRSKQKLKKKIKRFKPDIVHVHNFFPLLTPSIYDACKEEKIPVVQTLHNYRLVCSAASLMRNGRICEKCLCRSSYWAAIHCCYRNSLLGSISVARMIDYHRGKKTWQNKVDRFIALTEFSRNKFIEAQFPQKKISVKPNFIIDPIQSEQQREKHYKKRALFVGRLSYEKGIQTLIDAWRGIDCRLQITGDGPLYSDLKKEVSGNIELLGYLSADKVQKKMLESSFLILPSIWYEGFPMVIVESFACSLPVVASKLGSMAEIINDGYTGLHFNPGDVKDLRKKVQFMVDHPDLAKKMGANARKEYEQKYTPEKNYEMLINIYKDTIEGYKNKT